MSHTTIVLLLFAAATCRGKSSSEDSDDASTHTRVRNLRISVPKAQQNEPCIFNVPEAANCKLMNFEYCSSLANFQASNTRISEASSPSDNAYSKALDLEGKIHHLYELNKWDMVLEIVVTVLALVAFCGRPADKNSGWYHASDFTLLVGLAVDSLLQTLALVTSVSSLPLGSEMESARCFNYVSGQDGENALSDFNGSVKMVTVLGGVEIAVSLVGIIGDILSIKSKEGYIGVAMAMAFLDLVLSIIDFVIFSEDSKNNLDEMFRTLRSGSGMCVQCFLKATASLSLTTSIESSSTGAVTITTTTTGPITTTATTTPSPGLIGGIVGGIMGGSVLGLAYVAYKKKQASE
eukprot:gnl/MRDRNA2_/MRDRNA2_147768_c0_seq1.p1 gnl/MRDRNA2_/MRDRNA2_147768_c0~~gnl/MRDRNA2_/MRDRNA2_147768_c0_seq1.p1  ORF type:complete len:350 (+),score=40.22 gnl/MRDRNA2_/MRDRNA2_147768_c0_seq1:116-1165(+)